MVVGAKKAKSLMTSNLLELGITELKFIQQFGKNAELAGEKCSVHMESETCSLLELSNSLFTGC